MSRRTEQVFSNENKMRAMLDLRVKGYSLMSLATIYGVDHSTICYHIEKNFIERPTEELQFSIPKIIMVTGYHAKKIPLTYKEYLEQSIERMNKRKMSQSV